MDQAKAITRRGVTMRSGGLLLLPLGLALLALSTGNLFAKMGVPLSCAVILLGVRGRELGSQREVLFVVGAFVFSAAGDWFLSSRAGRETYFVAGIGLFFCAHLGYLAFAWGQGRLHRAVLGALLGLYLPYYAIWLRPGIGGAVLSGAVLGYLLISCLVLAVACGLRLRAGLKWPYVAGIGLIVLSDTVISFSEFLGYRALNWLILPTYYLAHLCVSWTVLGPEPRPRG